MISIPNKKIITRPAVSLILASHHFEIMFKSLFIKVLIWLLGERFEIQSLAIS